MKWKVMREATDIYFGEAENRRHTDTSRHVCRTTQQFCSDISRFPNYLRTARLEQKRALYINCVACFSINFIRKISPSDILEFSHTLRAETHVRSRVQKCPA